MRTANTSKITPSSTSRSKNRFQNVCFLVCDRWGTRSLGRTLNIFLSVHPSPHNAKATTDPPKTFTRRYSQNDDEWISNEMSRMCFQVAYAGFGRHPIPHRPSTQAAASSGNTPPNGSGNAGRSLTVRTPDSFASTGCPL